MRLIETILKQLKPTIDEMVEFNVVAIEKKSERKLSAVDIDYIRLNIILDLVVAIEKYTKPTDVLLDFNVKGSVKGSIVIDSVIERDDVSYPLYTTVIYAGGWNIQRLHYRYITKTSLPKTNNSELSTKLSNELKKMSKLEKFNDEISRLETRIRLNDKKVELSKKVSDSEIYEILLKDKSLVYVPWKVIVSRGADKNYGYDENRYESEMLKWKLDTIEGWKRKNIAWPQENSDSLKKTIKQLQIKISKL